MEKQHGAKKKCGICGASYSGKRCNHPSLFFSNSSAKRLQCRQCQKWILRTSISRHLATCPARNPKSGVDWKCTPCEKMFSSKNQLRVHNNAVHLKRFPCSICGKPLQSQVALERHKKAVHFKIRDHQCDLCEKNFVYAHHLNRHRQAIHFPVRFRCEWPGCDKSYAEQYTLDVHTKMYHGGISVPDS